jgi:hypothetical protein
MPVPVSSLSIVCASIREFVRTGLDAAAHNIMVSIGAPALVADDDNEHRVNLFFYRFEPYGFNADVRPDEIWRLRLFCLITALGADEDEVSAVENDLRMLGEVIRIFREQPVLAGVGVNGEQVRLQVVFSPVTDDQINQVWSTQNDATYRPSVIYEMVLAPIIPSQPRIEPPLAGALGNQAFASMAQRHAAFSGTAQGPLVPFRQVNTGTPQWAPALSWVYQNGLAHSLSFDVGSAAFAVFTPQLWVAGDPGETVDLVWEIWDSLAGWRLAGAPMTVTPFSSAIDPDHIPASNPPAFPQELVLAVSIPEGENAAQGLLYATRSATLVPGQTPIEIRSNPLLISLYRSP